MLAAGRHRRGFSLVELLVGLTIGLFICTGALAMFVSLTRQQTDMSDAARFERELREVMALMGNDVRRAGYAGLDPSRDNDQDGVIDVADLLFNPFTAADNDIAAGALSGEAAGSCVTYAYNLDEDSPPLIGGCDGCATLPSDFTTSPLGNANLPFDRDNLEMFGYRLNAGRIQTRSGFSAGDTAFDCNTGTWADLTGADIQVSSLNFAVARAQIEIDDADVSDADTTCADGRPCLCAREVTISLTARLAAMPLIERSMQRTVRVQNDKFVSSFDTSSPCLE